MLYGLFSPGDCNRSFLYVQEVIRPSGSPALPTGTAAQQIGACAARTGVYPDGFRWIAMQRGRVTVLAVTDRMTREGLQGWARTSVCG